MIYQAHAVRMMQQLRGNLPIKAVLIFEEVDNDDEASYAKDLLDTLVQPTVVRTIARTWVQSTDNLVALMCDTISFGTVTGTVSSVAFYADSGNTATSPLIARDEFDAPLELTGRDFSYAPSPEGIVSVVVASA